MFVMESLLVVPCLTYIDDSTLVSVAGDVEDCAGKFDRLSEALGLVRSPKPESNMITTKDSAPKILGVIFERLSGRFVIRIPDEKLESVNLRCAEMVELALERDAPYKLVAKLVGDVCYILCSGADRAGIQILRPIFPLMVKDNFDAMIKRRKSRRILVSTARKIQLLLEHYTPSCISVESAARQFVWLYTDASSNGSASGGPRAGAVLVDSGGNLHRTHTDDLPGGVQIDFHEAAAVLLAVRTFRRILRGKRVVVNGDNTVDCYAFVRASHKNLESALLISMVIIEMRCLDIAPFFTYVSSECNIADWVTRDDLVGCFSRLGASVVCEPVVCQEWHEPRSCLVRLREEGIDLAPEAVGKPEPNLKKSKLERPDPVAEVVEDPTAWALSLLELKDQALGAAGVAEEALVANAGSAAVELGD